MTAVTAEERVRRLVDGELDEREIEALLADAETDAALAAAVADAERVHEALGALEDLDEPVAPPDDFVDRTVLAAFEAKAREESAPPWTQLAKGRPLVVRMRPLALAVGLAAAAALALWLRTPAPATSGGVPAEHAAETAVRLVLPTEGARSVAVAGDFNDWATDATFLEDPEGDGVFVGTVRLSPGTYAYMFVVDGERWVTDPVAVTHRDDGFGQRNAVLRVD